MNELRKVSWLAAALLLLISGSALAAGPVVDELECLPKEANQVITAKAETDGGDTVRAFFRRVNPSGAFYFVELQPTGSDNFWAVLPRPEEREQQEITDEWWEILQERDWVGDRSRDEIEDLFDGFEYEAAEYFVAVYNALGERVSRSEEYLVEVLDRDDCEVELTPIEVGYSSNLTIGETTQEQVGKPVFHWLCEGIVTRLGSSGILRADDFCRSCVVAGWFPEAVAGAALVSGTTVHFREPRRASDVD